jgi:hypothetical protein
MLARYDADRQQLGHEDSILLAYFNSKQTPRNKENSGQKQSLAGYYWFLYGALLKQGKTKLIYASIGPSERDPATRFSTSGYFSLNNFPGAPDTRVKAFSNMASNSRR